MNSSTFVFGSELQGRGYATSEDVIIGIIMLTLSLSAISLGCLNIFFIKTMTIFRNAFGWFWASRTLGEIVVNVIGATYSAPVTLIQTRHMSPLPAISAYILAYIFATGSCLMHAVVSFNRCMAVYNPVFYKRFFTRNRCFKIIARLWIAVFFSGSFLIAFPCNMIGYSPQLYEYVFVKCSPNLSRDYSIVGTFINCGCLVLCTCTVMIDISTLLRIIYIRKILKWGAENQKFLRDIRFFAQTSVQNLTMIFATLVIVLANNRNHGENKLLHIFGFNALLLTYVNNALSLVLFNPEVRSKIVSRIRGASHSSIVKKPIFSVVPMKKCPPSQVRPFRSYSQLCSQRIRPVHVL